MMKSVFRTIVLAGLAWIVGLSAYAADYVKVSEKGGKDTYFALSDKPEVTFTADHLVLKTAKETINYPLSALLTFEFTNRPTGINALGTEESHVVFSFEQTLKGQGLQPGSRVSVYSVNGQTVASAVVDANGAVEIALDGQTGVFIVKTLTKSFKLIRK